MAGEGPAHLAAEDPARNDVRRAGAEADVKLRSRLRIAAIALACLRQSQSGAHDAHVKCDTIIFLSVLVWIYLLPLFLDLASAICFVHHELSMWEFHPESSSARFAAASTALMNPARTPAFSSSCSPADGVVVLNSRNIRMISTIVRPTG